MYFYSEDVDDVSGHYIRGSRSPPGIANHLLRSAVTNHAGQKVFCFKFSITFLDYKFLFGIFLFPRSIFFQTSHLFVYYISII